MLVRNTQNLRLLSACAALCLPMLAACEGKQAAPPAPDTAAAEVADAPDAAADAVPAADVAAADVAAADVASQDLGGGDAAQAELPGADVAPAALIPTPITVNGGPKSAHMKLTAGAPRALYSFPVTAGQIYSITGSNFGAQTTLYLGDSSEVSANSFLATAPGVPGQLSWAAASTGTLYLLLEGEGEGDFQVADGGTQLASGLNTLEFPTADNAKFFLYRFSVALGSTWKVKLWEPTTPPTYVNAGWTLGADCARDSSGGLATWWNGGGGGTGTASNPTVWEVPATETGKAFTGYYYLMLRPAAPVTLAVEISTP